MQTSRITTFLARGMTLALAGSFAAAADAGNGPTSATAEPQWLSIAQVHQKLETAGYRKIEKIEREHGGYEVRATDTSGARVKLHVNPRSGEPLAGQASARYAKGDDDARQRRGGDCNKRRCRDDLPPATGSATPPR